MAVGDDGAVIDEGAVGVPLAALPEPPQDKPAAIDTASTDRATRDRPPAHGDINKNLIVRFYGPGANAVTVVRV